MISKETILQNLSKAGYILPSFRQKYNISNKECYDIVHGAKSCIFCNDEQRFHNFTKGYKETCYNKTCIRKLRQIRTKRTNQERYGVDNISQACHIKDKKQQTCMERYNQTTFLNSEFCDAHYTEEGLHVTQTPPKLKKKENKPYQIDMARLTHYS